MTVSAAPTLLFLLGAPRSGTTMLERMLSSHPSILGGPEPHLLTPLAHLGPWARVDAAPYDHIVAAIGQKDFIARLPGGQADYWAACRAYGDNLYSGALAGSCCKIFMDKTPEYATIWPFLLHVYPDAHYIVLTRHPVAVFTSFADSFFDGDLRIAQNHDPILERYVPALAGFLRQTRVPHLHVRYEDLVARPEAQMRLILSHLNLTYDSAVLDYSRHSGRAQGLGDPLGVGRRRGPSTASMYSWVYKLAADADRLRFVEALVERLDPADLRTLGYPPEDFWRPLEVCRRGGTQARQRRLNRYLLERKLTVRGRALVQSHGALRRMLQRLRLACDVLLRQY